MIYSFNKIIGSQFLIPSSQKNGIQNILKINRKDFILIFIFMKKLLIFSSKYTLVMMKINSKHNIKSQIAAFYFTTIFSKTSKSIYKLQCKTVHFFFWDTSPIIRFHTGISAKFSYLDLIREWCYNFAFHIDWNDNNKLL